MRYSIKLKMATAFGIVILLSVITAMVALSGLIELDGKIDALVNQSAQRVKFSLELPALVGRLQREEKNFLLSSEEADLDRFDKLMVSLREQIKATLGEYRKVGDQDGLTRLTQVEGLFGEMVIAEDKVRTLGRIHSNAKAADMINGAGTNAANAALEALKPLLDRVETGNSQVPAQVRVAAMIRHMTTIWGQQRMALRNSAMASDDAATEAALKPLPGLLDEIHRLQDAVQPLLTTEPDNRAWTKFLDKFATYEKLLDDMLVETRKNTEVKAVALSSGEVRTIATKLNQAADEMVAQAEKGMVEDKLRADQTYGSVRALLIGAVLLSLLIAVAAASYIAHSIASGLGKAVGLANAVAVGDLGQTVAVTSNDEVRDLVEALNGMTANLRVTAGIADEIAKGNLTVEAKRLSDKDILGIALATMLEKLRAVVSDATGASDNVAAGSQQLSSGAEELSQGSTEQAAAEEASASMEEMAATSEELASQAEQLQDTIAYFRVDGGGEVRTQRSRAITVQRPAAKREPKFKLSGKSNGKAHGVKLVLESGSPADETDAGYVQY